MNKVTIKEVNRLDSWVDKHGRLRVTREIITDPYEVEIEIPNNKENRNE